MLFLLAANDAGESIARTWENPCGIIPINMTAETVRPSHMPWIARLGYKNNRKYFIVT